MNMSPRVILVAALLSGTTGCGGGAIDLRVEDGGDQQDRPIVAADGNPRADAPGFGGAGGAGGVGGAGDASVAIRAAPAATTIAARMAAAASHPPMLVTRAPALRWARAAETVARARRLDRAGRVAG